MLKLKNITKTYISGDEKVNALNSKIFNIVISVVLTVIAGLVPAKLAAKKDPAVVLRSE